MSAISDMGLIIVGRVVRNSFAFAGATGLFLFRLVRGAVQGDHRRGDLARRTQRGLGVSHGQFALLTYIFISRLIGPVICLTLRATITMRGLVSPVLMQLRRYWHTPLSWAVSSICLLSTYAFLLAAVTIFITVIKWNTPATLGLLD